MNDLKDKAKSKINAAADTARKTSDRVIEKSRDIAHNTGKTLVKQGKRLQNL